MFPLLLYPSTGIEIRRRGDAFKAELLKGGLSYGSKKKGEASKEIFNIIINNIFVSIFKIYDSCELKTTFVKMYFVVQTNKNMFMK
jgi:hypothetical protein